MEELTIGRIYRFKNQSELTRIFSYGGAGFYSGRGCTHETATPHNHIRASEVVPAESSEVNRFLELEMSNNFAKTANRHLISSLGDWVFEVSSGYYGYRCQKCAHWVYSGKEKRCKCDSNLEYASCISDRI